MKPVVALKSSVTLLFLRLSPDAVANRGFQVVDDMKPRDTTKELERYSLPLEEGHLSRPPKDADAHRPAVTEPFRPKVNRATSSFDDGLYFPEIALHAFTRQEDNRQRWHRRTAPGLSYILEHCRLGGRVVGTEL